MSIDMTRSSARLISQARAATKSASSKLKVLTQTGLIQERIKQQSLLMDEIKKSMVKDLNHTANTSVGRAGAALTPEALQAYSNDYRLDKSNIFRANALSTLPMSACAENRSYIQTVNYSYSHSLSRVPQATSQEYSGRCWLFAALNSMRYYIIRDLNLPDDFELSEAYLFFFDKIERANLYLENMINYRHTDINNFKLQCLMSGPVQDGGTWSFVVNLVNKYGIVPKTIYGESFNSSVSEEMNQALEDKLAQFANVIRTSRRSDQELREQVIRVMLPQIYQMLANCMGEPPKIDEQFTWEFNEAGTNVESVRHRGIYKTIPDLTPITFYNQFVEDNYNVKQMVVLRNDPRPTSEYYKVYTTEHTANMVGGMQDLTFNLPMTDIKRITADCIINEHPVWFACEVQRDFNPYYGLLAVEGYDYESLLGISMKQTKSEGLMTRNSVPSHAMAIVGLNLISEEGEDLRVDKWKIENSWGEFNVGDPGYLQMTDAWFDRYGYEVVVPIDMLPEDLRKIYDDKRAAPYMLPFNDIFGTYAGTKHFLK